MIEKARSNYSPLGRSLEKQTKTIKDQGKKQIIAVDDHGKQLVEYNELIEKDFNIHRDSISVDKVKRYLMNLLKKELLNLETEKKRINTHNLMYKCKTEGRIPKEFRNYQNPAELFKNLKNGNKTIEKY